MSKSRRFDWERELLRRGPANSTTRHILLTIATHADRRTLTTYVGLRTLARETGLSDRTVCSHLMEPAMHGGWITRTPRPGGGQWRTGFEYALTIPAVERASTGAVEPTSTGNGQSTVEPDDSALLNLTQAAVETDDNSLLKQVQTNSSSSVHHHKSEQGQRAPSARVSSRPAGNKKGEPDYASMDYGKAGRF